MWMKKKKKTMFGVLPKQRWRDADAKERGDQAEQKSRVSLKFRNIRSAAILGSRPSESNIVLNMKHTERICFCGTFKFNLIFLISR